MEALSSEFGSRNKQAVISSALIDLARQRGPGIKLPTMKELSRRFGVTVTTLDRCFKKLEDRGFISRKRGSGIYVEDRIFHKRIALVFGGNIFQPGVSAFNHLLLQHCKLRASQHNERFSVYFDIPGLNDTPEQSGISIHQDLADALAGQTLDGMLLVGMSKTKREELLAYGLPNVSLGENSPGTLSLDYENLIELGIRNLLDQNCQSIGLFGILSEHRDVFVRLASHLGVQASDQWIIATAKRPEWDTHEKLGREWAGRLLEQSGGAANLPEGILFTDDILARGALKCFERHGIAVGRHFKAVSHANKGSDVLKEWEEQLTLIEFDLQEIVEAMFGNLELLMSGDSLPNGQTKIKAHIAQKLSSL